MVDRQTKAPGKVSRRSLFRRLWKIGIGFLLAEGALGSYSFLWPRVSGGFGAKIRAGSPEQFSEGTVRYYPEGRFYVTRVKGELLALYQKCPHLGCRVPWCEQSGRFECPCHGSIFNRNGEYIQGPSPRGMDRFPLQVAKDEVVVDTGTTITGPRQGIDTLQEEPKGPSCL